MTIWDEQTLRELGQAGSSPGASLCAPVEGQCHPQRGLHTAPHPGPGGRAGTWHQGHVTATSLAVWDWGGCTVQQC